jgi:isochorismate synthase
MINPQISITYTITEVLDLLLSLGLDSGASFALWRKPKSYQIEFVSNESSHVAKTSINLEELKPGFMVHPFEDQKDKKAFYIEAATYWKFPIQENIETEDLPEAFLHFAENKFQEQTKKTFKTKCHDPNKNVSPTQINSTSKSHFISLVEEGIAAIQAGKVEKVVPARTQYIKLDENFDLAKSICSMLKAYPNSFVNFFHIPTIGTWIGASPEVLIETKENKFFTMSLAGTQPAMGENPLKTAAWTQKEIEEQALVSRYIVDCFKKIRLREYEEHGPKTVLAGTLLHLRSDFRVDMEATNFPQLGSVMLELLHPTSAVCGMPRKEAHEFLQTYENLDRSFFAGFIGPVNIEGETSIYVNLRTASLSEGHAILYAGAGVTEDSDPEKEWEETELKCQIIGKFLQNPSA